MCERFTHVTLYSENSVWEWQSTLGKLFSLIGLGDIEEARSQMKLAFKRVPEVMSQRLTEQLVTSLLQQNEVQHSLGMEPLLALKTPVEQLTWFWHSERSISIKKDP